MTIWPCHTRPLMLAGYLLALGGLAGCQSLPRTGRAVPSASSPNPPPVSNLAKRPPEAKPIILKVTVDSPLADLKIRPGSYVRKGQIVANPDKRRSALENQKKELEAKLNAIANAEVVSLETQSEQKNITLAQKQYDAAQAALQEYKNNSPWTDFARNNLPLAKEEVQLTRLQKNVQQAQTNLELAKTKLSQKQATIGQFQRERSLIREGVQKNLLQVETQLATLKPVKSAHAGTVTKVDIPETAALGQPVTVTVVLMPGDAPVVQPNSETPLGLPSDTPLKPRTGSAIDLLPPGTIPDQPAATTPPNSTVE